MCAWGRDDRRTTGLAASGRLGRIEMHESQSSALPRPLMRLHSPTFFGEQQVYMPTVKVRENEPFDVALRRFKRSCEKAGVLSEIRRREFYEKPTSIRKRMAAAAVKRHIKKLQREAKRLNERR